MKDMPAFVLIITAESRYSDVMLVLKNYSEGRADFISKIGENQIVFVKFIDEDNNEYQSSTEYAEFLRLSVYEETGIQVRISVGGTVKTLVDLTSSYSQAMTALRMSKAMEAKGDVHSFKEYVLIRMLEEMPKHKLNEYLEILMDTDAKDVFNDPEMIETAEEFLENSLNVSETARKLYLHRNTLTYRLDKIERSTGLNIRKFADAITFRLVTILSKLVK
jgi:carbohydrate diacid regulator